MHQSLSIKAGKKVPGPFTVGDLATSSLAMVRTSTLEGEISVNRVLIPEKSAIFHSPSDGTNEQSIEVQ